MSQLEMNRASDPGTSSPATGLGALPIKKGPDLHRAFGVFLSVENYIVLRLRLRFVERN
jgi:hypothetical protein